MGVGGLFKLALIGVVLSVFALYFRYGSSKQFDAQPYSLPPRPKLEGPLAVNSGLQKATFILKDQIDGPESLVIDGDKIYATTYDGAVVEITKGRVTKTIRFTNEKDCGNYESEPRCGRPLGIRRFGNTHEFLVADAYLGLYRVNFNTGAFKRLVKGDAVVDGRRLRFLNDVEILNEDELLFTDSTSKWERRHFMHPILEQIPNGRVLRYRVSTNELSTVLDGLYFANGLQILPDKQSFLVAETSMARIKRHYILGPKAGKTEVFAANLPGLPDNVRLATDGTLWVGTAGIRHADAPSLLDTFAAYPAARQFAIDVVPSWFWANYFHKFKPKHTLILQLDLQGKIISSLHDPDSSVITDVSQVSDDADYLYLGSYHSKFIAKIRKH